MFKWILGGLVALVAAVFVAGYVILSNLDLEYIRNIAQEEAEKATGRKLVLSGPIDLKISMSPSIAIDDVVFANAAWGSRPEMMKMKRFELEVALMPLISQDINVKRVVLIEPDILVETNDKGVGNWVMGDESGEEAASGQTAQAGAAGEEQVLPTVDLISIKNGRVTYRDGQTGAVTRIGIDALDLTTKQAGAPPTLEFIGSYNEQPIELAGTIGSFEQLQDGPYPFDLTASAGGAQIEVGGNIAKPQTAEGVNLQIVAKGENLGDLGALTGGDLPAVGPYDLRSGVEKTGNEIKLTGLALKLGESDLSGNANLVLGGKPTVKGSMTSTLFDLRDISAEASPGGAPEAEKSAGGGTGDGKFMIPDTPLPLGGMKAANADLSLKVGTLKVDDAMQFTDVDLTLKLNEGRLQIAPLLAVFSDGKIDMNVDLDGSKQTPVFSTKTSVTGADYGKLLKQFEVSNDVTGIVDINLDLQGSGDTPRAIASGLNGNTEVISDSGTINNRLLKVVGVGLANIMGPLLGNDETARINCIVSRFDIRDGIATSKALVFDSESFTVGGDGKLNLKNEQLDFYLDTSTRQSSLASLAIPFKVQGTLKNPSFTPDPIGTAKGIAEGAAKIAEGAGLAGGISGNIGAIGDLIGGKKSSDGEQSATATNPCVAALSGVAVQPAQQPAQQQQPVQQAPAGPIDEGKKVLDDASKAIEGGIKKLFGD